MRVVKPRWVLAATCAAVLSVVACADAEEVTPLRTFYFGNSFTGNTKPGLAD